MDYIFNLVEEIRNSPGMYFGKRDIFAFKAFVDGWLASRESVISLHESVEYSFFGAFQKWVEQEHHCDLTISWAKIFFMHASDEYEALDTCLEAMIQFRDTTFADSKRGFEETGENPELGGRWP